MTDYAKILKTDIAHSDIASHGELNPTQRQAKPRKKGRLDVYGVQKASKPPKMDSGLSAPVLTGSFAAGKGQSTIGTSKDRYDPTAIPPKPPSTPSIIPPAKKDPISKDQQLAPVGPTYIGVFEKSGNLKKKIKRDPGFDGQTSLNPFRGPVFHRDGSVCRHYPQCYDACTASARKTELDAAPSKPGHGLGADNGTLGKGAIQNVSIQVTREGAAHMAAADSKIPGLKKNHAAHVSEVKTRMSGGKTPADRRARANIGANLK